MAPFAAGVHLPWSGVPAAVRLWANGVAGAEPREVFDLPGGFSPGATARLRFDASPDIFVKAVGLERNPESPSLHRREALISRSLPVSPLWPRLIELYDDGDWVALAFEAVDGQMPVLPWVPAELDVVLASLADMHRLLSPNPSDAVVGASDRLVGTFGGWLRLASAEVLPAGLDEWSRQHLDELVGLESAWPQACRGDTLLHLGPLGGPRRRPGSGDPAGPLPARAGGGSVGGHHVGRRVRRVPGRALRPAVTPRPAHAASVSSRPGERGSGVAPAPAG